jgi:hypothetical protein
MTGPAAGGLVTPPHPPRNIFLSDLPILTVVRFKPTHTHGSHKGRSSIYRLMMSSIITAGGRGRRRLLTNSFRVSRSSLSRIHRVTPRQSRHQGKNRERVAAPAGG